jgi:tRNA (cytidine56-2'-O)-methyltransferase
MIEVLRLSHRPFRDKRITTHCALVARAFNADSIVYSGQKDSKLESTIVKTADNFGGKFSISYQKDPIAYIKSKKAANHLIIHLTVYGMPIQDKISSIRNKDCLIVVGSEKVPPEVYDLANFNLSVTSQPHSEVAALAIFLHEYHQGKQLKKQFTGGKSEIIPQEKGKLVNSKLYK